MVGLEVRFGDKSSCHTNCIIQTHSLSYYYHIDLTRPCQHNLLSQKTDTVLCLF